MEEFEPDTKLVERLRAIQTPLVVLPLRFEADGCGIYAESSVFLVKELKQEGVDACFLDPSELRKFEVKKSAIAAAAAFIGLAIAGGASYDSAKAGFLRLIGKGDQDQQVTVEIIRIEPSGGATGTRIVGTAKDVSKVLEALPPLPDTPKLPES